MKILCFSHEIGLLIFRQKFRLRTPGLLKLPSLNNPHIFYGCFEITATLYSTNPFMSRHVGQVLWSPEFDKKIDSVKTPKSVLWNHDFDQWCQKNCTKKEGQNYFSKNFFRVQNQRPAREKFSTRTRSEKNF